MKEIKQRHVEYLGHDTYGYCTECKTCGEKVTGWSELQANENWDKHECKLK